MSVGSSPTSANTPPRIPLARVTVGEQSRALVGEVLDSGILAQGPKVAALEDAFATVAGTEHCVAVTNGTLALQAAMLAAGIGAGDEVITTAFTFVATINAALSVGACVRLVDIGADYTIDTDALADAMTERTRAVVPVHLYGLPADMPTLSAQCTDRGVTIIEDAAQAHGANVAGRPAGSWGAAGCFSLYATKNIAAGEGGLVSTDDAALADRIRTLRNQGMRKQYDYAGWGSNWRMTDLHAAIALPQVWAIEQIAAHRARNAQRLGDGLADLERDGRIVTPHVPPGRVSAWHQYTVALPAAAPHDRDALAAGLRERGIGSAVFYPQSLAEVAHLRDHPDVHAHDLTRTRNAAATVLSLPVGPHVSDADVDDIISAVHEVLGV